MKCTLEFTGAHTHTPHTCASAHTQISVKEEYSKNMGECQGSPTDMDEAKSRAGHKGGSVEALVRLEAAIVC